MAAMVTAIVPAAGRSRRMGRPKLLLPLGDGTVLGATLASLAAGGVGRLIVVTRHDDRALRAWLRREAAGEIATRRALPALPTPRVVVAVNPDPERGMLSSVRQGLAALASSELDQPVLVCPADLPALAPETVAAVLAALAPGRVALAVPLHGARRGHPLAIAADLVPEVFTLDPEVGLRQLLDRHRDDLVEVPVVDAGCVRDVDTPEDYRELGGDALPPRDER